MSSRNMSLLPRATLHSESEQLLRTICHKVGLAIITVGPSDMEEQWTNFSWDPMNGFGVDEQLVHFGVHLSQGPNVFETQCPWTETCRSNCH